MFKGYRDNKKSIDMDSVIFTPFKLAESCIG